MLMNGAQAVLESLKRENVEVIFGYPGGAVLDLYDALYKTKYPHILTRHEQGAVHAADGYARATGKVGVCFATSGPGATNLITGIATANMDSIPLVCFTGQVTNPLIGKDSFQEADIVGITRQTAVLAFQFGDGFTNAIIPTHGTLCGGAATGYQGGVFHCFHRPSRPCGD